LLTLKLESTGASSEAESPLPDALRQDLAYFHKRYSALMKNYLVISEPIASSPTGVSLLIDWAKEVAEKYGTAQAPLRSVLNNSETDISLCYLTQSGTRFLTRHLSRE
jgi:hypothetical protein